jgi:hypothetical protein
MQFPHCFSEEKFMVPVDVVPPDETYSAAEAGRILRKSERQVLRYLTSGALKGSKASGRWQITALQIWQFQGIAAEMLANWRMFCREYAADENFHSEQTGRDTGE